MWSVFKSMKAVGFRLRFDQSGKKKMFPPPTFITRRMCANICAVFKACTRCRWRTSMPERTPKPPSPGASSSSLSRRHSGNVRIWCDGCRRLSEKFCWLCTANKQLEFTFCVIMCEFRPEAVSKVWADAIGVQMWPGRIQGNLVSGRYRKTGAWNKLEREHLFSNSIFFDSLSLQKKCGLEILEKERKMRCRKFAAVRSLFIGRV